MVLIVNLWNNTSKYMGNYMENTFTNFLCLTLQFHYIAILIPLFQEREKLGAEAVYLKTDLFLCIS